MNVNILGLGALVVLCFVGNFKDLSGTVVIQGFYLDYNIVNIICVCVCVRVVHMCSYNLREGCPKDTLCPLSLLGTIFIEAIIQDSLKGIK